MPTPNERRALIFFTGVALLGGGARALHALREAPPAATAESRRALALQIDAVDSARRAERSGPGGKRPRRAARPSRAATSGSVAAGGAMSSSGSRAVAGLATVAAAPATVTYRVDRSAERAFGTGAAGGVGSGVSGVAVDVDRAGEAELEALPRVGPVLARRIVANRDSLGPFGSMSGLRRVSGVGPAMASGLAPYVTFSGSVRQIDASEVVAGNSRGRRSQGRRSRP